MSEVKRLHYFNHQFLEEADFREEQAYHIEMRRRHNQGLHTWGVVNGFRVERTAHHGVIVQPGMAVDAEGREIVLQEAVHKELSGHPANGHVYLSVAFVERFSEDDRQGEGARSYTRVIEAAHIEVHQHRPPQDGSVIALARVNFDAETHIREIDTGIQRHASAIIGGNSVGAEELQDSAVTEAKLSEELRSRIGRTHGWIRLPFKPSLIEKVRLDNPEAEIKDNVVDFDIGFVSAIGYSRAGSRGARGCMGIPVPVGARRIRALRLAGWTKTTVEIALVRTGWRNDRCEEADLLTDNIAAPHNGYFNHLARTDHKLEDDDALVIVVGVRGPARIFTVAAEFE